MSLDTAVKSIEYLRSVGCRAFGFMGGEPLLRRDFVLDTIRYGARRGFFVDLATNGILMDKGDVDRMGAAGIASVNIAIDAVEEHSGLPKCLARVKPVFDYLVKRRYEYGYLVFINVNITSKNLGDVKELTRRAHDYGIGIDYHLSELPLAEEDRRKYRGAEYAITEKDQVELDELVDWILDKQHEGHTILNSEVHLRAMKDYVRGELKPWNCRAGYNAVVVREDGTLVPCMSFYAADGDWGDVYGGYRLSAERLAAMRAECNRKCLSTLHYQIAEVYNNFRGNNAWRIWNWA
jgi:MoaA/NifB/PqqE/SkfB family radical SAM enzyme